jgi:hypothetical protein
MTSFLLPAFVQLSLMFGIAGLLWPEKFLPIFEVLMFPWAASYRIVRAHGVAAIALSVVLFAGLVLGVR